MSLRAVQVFFLGTVISFLSLSNLWGGEITMDSRKMPPTLEIGSYKFTGAGGCNKEKCHGHATKNRANEYTTWIKAEIHSAGYSVLFEKDAKEIAKKFGVKGKAGDDKRCAVCHTIYLEHKPGLKGEKFDINEGVTCEICHGPGSGYIEPHAKPYQPEGVKGDALWKARAKRHKESVGQGMWDAKNLGVRAETCVFCHYQISKKMLDAGHPDLTFELGYFQKTMPEHWEETPDKGAGYPAKVAAAGQAITLREALKKLASNKDEGSLAQAKSHINILKAIGKADGIDTKGLPGNAGALAGKADGLFKKLVQASFSKGDTPKFINGIASDSHLTGSPSRKEAEQVFMFLDGLYSKYDQADAVLNALDDLYYSLYAEEGQPEPEYDSKGFGGKLAKLKGLVK